MINLKGRNNKKQKRQAENYQADSFYYRAPFVYFYFNIAIMIRILKIIICRQHY